jgi:large subunit ribosomal protein L15e
MARSYYTYVGDAWDNPKDGPVADLHRKRLVEWRRGPTVERVDRPTRIDRARALGFKAKPGFVVVRAKVRRGSLRKRAIVKGRKPKKRGINKITSKLNLKRIAEQRAHKRYPNLEILNSYWVGEDGRFKYYEVIFVDPDHPSIRNDPKINWICKPNQKGRTYRGKTSAGIKTRGLRKRGKGAEHLRPSRRSTRLRGRRVNARKKDYK